MKSQLVLILCGLLLAGCISIGDERLADEALVAQIKVGATREQVASLLGKPSHVRSSVSMGYTREWWSYKYSSSVVNPLEYFLLYGLFINGVGTPDIQRELDIFYSPEGIVTTLSHVTTSYDLSGPYSTSKVASITKIETLPSGFGNPVHFEDRVGYQNR